MDGHIDEYMNCYNYKHEGPIFNLMLQDISHFYPVKKHKMSGENCILVTNVKQSNPSMYVMGLLSVYMKSTI